tara:strand:- start:1290 stop:1733 length:444 start_codon:yes stop_codon:yes gene_type:complete
MNLSDLINNSHPVKDPTVLGSIWTDDKSLCSSAMLKSGEQMLTDMVECQDLIATLDIASKEKIEIPKLSAKFIKQDDDFDFIKVTIKSKIPDEFANLMWDIQEGRFPSLSYRVKTDKYLTSIRTTPLMDKYILSTEDNVNIINATLT